MKNLDMKLLSNKMFIIDTLVSMQKLEERTIVIKTNQLVKANQPAKG